MGPSVSPWREVARVEGHGGAVCWCAWSPDGTRLATTSGDMTVRVWLVAGAHTRSLLSST
jgi:WD40 repeat protein